MLQQLLQYLAEKTFSHGAEPIKEYTIGVEALGRSPDFDPKTDPIVRVQIHRLRQKLKEYYDSDGLRDYIVIEIPKGQYLPIFGTTESAATLAGKEPVSGADALPPGDQVLQSSPDPVDPQAPPSGKAASRAALIAIVVAIAAFAVGLWAGSQWLASGSKNSTAIVKSNPARSSDPVMVFWENYIGNDPSPVIAYPDEVFLLDNYNDLFRFRRGAIDFRGAPVDPHLAEQFASNPALVAKAGQLYYENSYLGFGELKAVGMLSNLFGQMGLKPVIKPSRELTVDDLKQHNVIILGSSFSNIAEAHFGALGDFSFKNPDARLEQWRGMIINAHPRTNESPSYHTERDPSTLVLKSDYSLITIQPGITPGRYIADLGGLDTTGSEGAVLYTTSRLGVEELSKAIQFPANTGGGRSFPVFQALLRVELEKGYDILGVSLVTVHMLPLAQPARENGGSSQVSQP
jgi:hypothetical protein